MGQRPRTRPHLAPKEHITMNWIQIIYLIITSNLTWLIIGALTGQGLAWAIRRGKAKRNILVRVISDDARTETTHWVRPGAKNTVKFEHNGTDVQLPITTLIGDKGHRIMYAHADNMRPIDFHAPPDEPQKPDEMPGDYLTRTWDGFRMAKFTAQNFKPWEDEAGFDTNLLIITTGMILAIITIALHFWST